MIKSKAFLSVSGRISRRRLLAVLLAGGISMMGMVAGVARAGLYDSDATAVKNGPLLDRDYWRAKWDSIQLPDAVKERQPEGAVLIAVIEELQLLDGLIKTYPNDEDFKKWQSEAQAVQAKIDPNANRSDEFKPGCLWAETNYQEAYVNYHYAKVAIDQQNWEAARDGIMSAQRNLEPLQQRIKDNDRVNAWPEGAAAWVTKTAAEVASMDQMVSEKLK